MPIRFKSRHSPDIVMLETAGRELIRMMGHSGTVPGALGADAVSSALQRLEKAVAQIRQGTIRDSKTIIGLQSVYLQKNT